MPGPAAVWGLGSAGPRDRAGACEERTRAMARDEGRSVGHGDAEKASDGGNHTVGAWGPGRSGAYDPLRAGSSVRTTVLSDGSAPATRSRAQPPYARVSRRLPGPRGAVVCAGLPWHTDDRRLARAADPADGRASARRRGASGADARDRTASVTQCGLPGAYGADDRLRDWRGPRRVGCGLSIQARTARRCFVAWLTCATARSAIVRAIRTRAPRQERPSRSRAVHSTAAPVA